jgi:hypothetical protein
VKLSQGDESGVPTTQTVEGEQGSNARKLRMMVRRRGNKIERKNMI